jgi:hypothetical protein
MQKKNKKGKLLSFKYVKLKKKQILILQNKNKAQKIRI